MMMMLTIRIAQDYMARGVRNMNSGLLISNSADFLSSLFPFFLLHFLFSLFFIFSFSALTLLDVL